MITWIWGLVGRQEDTDGLGRHLGGELGRTWWWVQGERKCQGYLVQQLTETSRTESGLAVEKDLQGGASKTSPCRLCFSYIRPRSILYTCLHVMLSRGPLLPKFWDPELEGAGKVSEEGTAGGSGSHHCRGPLLPFLRFPERNHLHMAGRDGSGRGRAMGRLVS